MRGVRVVVVFSLAALIASLALARIHPFGDAGLYTQRSKLLTPPTPSTAGVPRLMEHSSIPDDVRAILTAKCADCHSEQTRSPMYGRLAPVSWWMERDIVQARRAMNLSRWDSYSAEEQDAFRANIALQVKIHNMPLIQYEVFHPKAEITDADIRVLTQWAQQASLQNSNPDERAAMEGDAGRGRELFERRCTGCHAMEQNREGPRLSGVFGRTSGTASEFAYSAGLKNAHIVWNDTTLERWLADPDAMVPENNMGFQVARPQERRDLIRFLKESAAK
jgi:cytochrome c